MSKKAVLLLALASCAYGVYTTMYPPPKPIVTREDFFIDDKDPLEVIEKWDVLDKIAEEKAVITGLPAVKTRPTYTQEELVQMKEPAKDLSYAERSIWDLTHGKARDHKGRVKKSQMW